MPLRGEQLVVGTTLPAVHALGDITMFWPVPKPPLPARIALQLRCRLHGHPAADDYAPEPQGSTKTPIFLIKLTLHPRQITSDSTAGAKADQRRLAETVKRLSVSLEGMTVLSLKRDGSTWAVELEGTGERWVQAGERDPWRVFQGACLRMATRQLTNRTGSGGYACLACQYTCARRIRAYRARQRRAGAADEQDDTPH